MRRAKFPLNPEAAEKADKTMEGETGGRPISKDPEDAHLRKKWMDVYIDAAGPDSYTETRKERKETPKPIQQCKNNEQNYVELKYLYADGEGVAGASYEVIDLDTNIEVTRGSLDDGGYCYANLPLSTKRIKYRFYNDPKFVEFLITPVPNKEQSKVKQGWVNRVMENAKAVGSWTWGVIKGDFNEDPTVGQIAANMGITLIPVVDQIGDLRDITANLKFLIWDKRYKDKSVWFSLVITVLGCIPTLGSLLKGIGAFIKKAIKSGNEVKIEDLIKVFNYYTKGHSVKYLREVSEKLPEYGKFAKDKIKGILKALIDWFEKASTYLPGKLGEEAKGIKESAEKVLESIDDQVDEVINELQHSLDEALNESTNFSKEGGVKTLNESKQVATKPPDLEPDDFRSANTVKKVYREKFMNQQLKKILADTNHPLSFLVNYKNKTWLGRRHASEINPSVQAGHATSKSSGAEERLFLEDADKNQLSNWVGESKGVYFKKEGVLIGDVPVELETAKQWERLNLLPKSTVANAPKHPGWTP